MANLNNAFGWRPVKNWGDMEEFTTTSNLTILEGTPVVRKADGTIGAAGTTSTGVFGVAAHGLTGETGVRKQLLIWPAKLDTMWEAQCATGTVVNLTEAVGAVAGYSAATGGYALLKLGATTSLCVTKGFHTWTGQDLSLAVLRFNIVKSTWVRQTTA